MSVVLTCSLLMLFNMLRGQGAISHSHWVCMVWIITGSVPMMLISSVVTLEATSHLLDLEHGKVSWRAFVRNMPILPVLWYLHSYTGLVLLLQPLVYWLCGKWNDNRATRLAEGISGVMLGLV